MNILKTNVLQGATDAGFGGWYGSNLKPDAYSGYMIYI